MCFYPNPHLPLSGERPGALEILFLTLDWTQGRPKGVPKPLFSWGPNGPLPNDNLPDLSAGSFMPSQSLPSVPQGKELP